MNLWWTVNYDLLVNSVLSTNSIDLIAILGCSFPLSHRIFIDDDANDDAKCKRMKQDAKVQLNYHFSTFLLVCVMVWLKNSSSGM